MPRQEFVHSSPAFAVDPHKLVRNSGRQIDWASVNASFIKAATGKKFLPAGTLVGLAPDGRRLAERTATRAAIGILATDAHEDDRSAAVTGYGIIIGGPIYINLLPVTPDATMLTELRAVANTTGWYFETYGDSRNS